MTLDSMILEAIGLEDHRGFDYSMPSDPKRIKAKLEAVLAEQPIGLSSSSSSTSSVAPALQQLTLERAALHARVALEVALSAMMPFPELDTDGLAKRLGECRDVLLNREEHLKDAEDADALRMQRLMRDNGAEAWDLINDAKSWAERMNAEGRWPAI